MRVVIMFEGRDAAGKSGAIHRFMQHLNPRDVQVVALTKPTPRKTSRRAGRKIALTAGQFLARGGEE